LLRSADGTGAVELGLLAPVLLLLLLGIADFGMAYWQQMQVANAADAGAQWGMSNPYDAASIQTVATSATNLSGIAVTPSEYCGCPASTGVTIYSCNSTCPDNSLAKSYIVVNARICYSTLFTWPGLPYCSTGASNCDGCAASQIALKAQSVVLK
jgi:Flp pilus assembly protein TadG